MERGLDGPGQLIGELLNDVLCIVVSPDGTFLVAVGETARSVSAIWSVVETLSNIIMIHRYMTSNSVVPVSRSAEYFRMKTVTIFGVSPGK